jgi:DNA-binding MarR family transcriptional regulator
MKRRQSVASAAKPAVRRSVASPARAEKLSLGQLNHHLGFFLRRLQIWVFQDFIQTLRLMKVRPAQYSVLLIIEANPGHSQAAIGQALSVERARLARMLHELERRKWVTRRANGSDARAHSLYLTADGEKALVKIKSLAEKHEARLAEHVGAKRHMQLMDLLRDFG